VFGFLNINKPSGMTSHDVIGVLRKITGVKQIGHGGTLDPLACGVLPVAIGKASRLLEYLDDDKAYIAEFEFGKISDTYDIEGNVENYSDKKVSRQDIVGNLKNFEGKIEQIPPAHSAVHYKGKRLYELARNGEIPDDIPKRTIEITGIKLIEFDEARSKAKIYIECSKGTYVRSIINDLGMMLGSGAVMTGLARTKSGKFTIESSVPLENIKNIENVEKNLINPLEVLPFSCYNLSDAEYEKIKHGQIISCKNTDGIYVLAYNSKIVAVAQVSINFLKVKKVF
jgi:tRNA pseudouridine55 synthase